VGITVKQQLCITRGHFKNIILSTANDHHLTASSPPRSMWMCNTINCGHCCWPLSPGHIANCAKNSSTVTRCKQDWTGCTVMLITSLSMARS